MCNKIHEKEVTITDMMNCRERRARIQKEYIERYHCSILSFCMNIPGPVKTNDRIRAAFEVGKQEISDLHLPVKEYIEYHDPTGDELLMAVDMNAAMLKKEVTSIEEQHPLGRLFDMDVLAPDGNKLSRPSFRPCLICGRQAQVCARMRRHSIPEMLEVIWRMLDEYFF